MRNEVIFGSQRRPRPNASANYELKRQIFVEFAALFGEFEDRLEVKYLAFSFSEKSLRYSLRAPTAGSECTSANLEDIQSGSLSWTGSMKSLTTSQHPSFARSIHLCLRLRSTAHGQADGIPLAWRLSGNFFQWIPRPFPIISTNQTIADLS